MCVGALCEISKPKRKLRSGLPIFVAIDAMRASSKKRVSLFELTLVLTTYMYGVHVREQSEILPVVICQTGSTMICHASSSSFNESIPAWFSKRQNCQRPFSVES